MSTQRTMPGGFADPKSLERGPGGRPLCRWCELEIPLRRRTFCSDFCVHQWRLRSDPGYLREQVLARDRGICAVCKLDCVAEWRRLRRIRGERRVAALAAWGLTARSRKSLWDADHIVPVVEGGGECELSNLRTLCLRCHREATAALRQRRASSQAAAASN